MVDGIRGEEEQGDSEDSEDHVKLVSKDFHRPLKEKIITSGPGRNIGGSSRGVDNRVVCAFCDEAGRHFPHSCPQKVDVAERYVIAMRKGLCKHI
ncbi:hypothetical protein ANCDUO_11786 [Ancylostoma duodenale]|uniref:CCHC-type domain-containing protein n=1 Tax=Ancylostoma duodenale TaxID=51022 RepID=A0A0C2GAJ3_9BILA|nr:hypothetical protein ANCDUO_11786 [Ancylostoma duodenale]